MQKISIVNRILISFGIILSLLYALGVISHIGVSDVVKNTEEVIAGNMLDRNLAQREIDHLNLAKKIDLYLISGDVSRLEVETDDHNCAFGKWLYGEDRKKTETLFPYIASLLKEIEEPHRNLHKSAIDISNARSKEEAKSIYVSQTAQSLEKIQELIEKIRETAKNNIITNEAMLNLAIGAKRNILVAGTAAIIIGILLAWINGRGIKRILQRVSAQLSNIAEKVASASSQVSSTSKYIADGVSEQAASIEETSSSLEEMSSMTKKNSENASHVNKLMSDTSRIMEDTNNSIKDLTKSMNEISSASEKTAKIIKTIDEIAFQTNLLALNAAVEAARAGEAGAGFAVVAGEVRNLAMRAAEAAKNTANLIDGTVNKIKSGSEIVVKTNEAFEKMAAGAKKVGELVGEIAVASREQAQGITQVNVTVAEMDKVVQHNAASAEESTSVADEMRTRADKMERFADYLMFLVSGRKVHKMVPAKAASHKAIEYKTAKKLIT